jgi:hypothetical protein
MAEKKTVNKEENKEKLVKVKLEKTRTNKDPLFVSVNDRMWRIQRGVWVEVPECVAEQIEHHNRMLDERIEFEESLQKM